MKQYLDLCNRIVNEGKWVDNIRTGNRCLTVIDASFEYDVSEGEFPMLTTRKVFWKQAISEMLGYLRGYTTIEEFKALGCNTWDANGSANIWKNNPYWSFEGDLGRMYGAQGRGWDVPKGTPIKVERKIGTYHEDVKVDSSLNHGYGIGDVVPDNPTDVHLRNIWYGMIRRCYDDTFKEYHNYGGKGVFVAPRWHKLSNFLADVKRLPNWFHKRRDLQGYELDKDYYGSNCYSIDTCFWLSVSDNRLYANSKGLFEVFYGSGECVGKYISMVQAARDLDLNPAHISSCLAGNRQHHKGYTFSWLDQKNIYRYAKPVDQLQDVYNDLKQGIDNRSEIMTFMNPGERDRACLNSCMHTHTFSILDGELYLTSYQRSCDVPLGLVFNHLQVAWFLMVMAQITGLKPAKAYHKIINAHIYENQLPLMKNTHLGREPLGLPTLEINPNIRTLRDLETWVTADDFKVVGYISHPGINYPFSV